MGAVRCAYPAALDARVRSLLAPGAKVEVRGSHEPTNRPRLVQVEGEIAEAESAVDNPARTLDVVRG